MLLKLESCTHEAAIPYSFIPSTDPDSVTEVHAICPRCYQRVILSVGYPRVAARPDIPAVVCHHPNKRPISEAITRRQPYQDAFCIDCGRVLRHPDGPGRWEEVRFYGYLIQEEPWV